MEFFCPNIYKSIEWEIQSQPGLIGSTVKVEKTSGEKMKMRLTGCCEIKRKLCFELLDVEPQMHCSGLMEKWQLIPITCCLENQTLLIMKSDFARDTTPELLKKFKQGHVEMMHDLTSTLKKIAKGELKMPTNMETHQVMH